MSEILDIPIYDDDLLKLGFRLLHDIAFLSIIVLLAWHPRPPSRRDREFAFTTVMLNITVFFICFTMKKLDIGLGMAIGLFAIFGVLRYRTDAIRTKDMTYLFVAIGIAVVNALSNGKTSYTELLAVNGAIVVATFVGERLTASPRRTAATDESAESRPESKPEAKQTVEYDRLDLLAAGREQDLLEDLRRRTHLAVCRAKVKSIDLPAGRATLTIWIDASERRRQD